jgi:zinc transport system ATP-binding protein
MTDPAAAKSRPAASAPLAAARGLGIRRGGRWLLHDIDFEVARGEIVTVIGPNGAGKTTLIKALLGLIEPSRGRIERGASVSIGYVPQRLHVDWTLPLTVDRLMTLTRRAAPDAIAAALQEAGVGHLAGSPVQELSGGEFQRMLLARAIVARPDLLVLDEPVQGVDYSGEIALYELIAELRDRLSCGVLLVSHDLHVVMKATDRVVCLNGHVCCTGEPRDVARDPEYLRLFGARGAEAVAIYTHSHDHEHGIDGEVIGPGHAHRHDHGHLDDHGHGHGHAHPGGPPAGA